MQITFREADTAIVAKIAGSIDGLTSEALQAALLGELLKGHHRIVADFEGVDYTSSAGLRVILATVKEARRNGGDFRLAAVRPAVMRVLQMSGFAGIVKIYPDAESAVASFK
ncbi:MAG: STAS domain-containing protein [Betaproteobacteria bacterium]|nr:STAS domain-containing protein [Betaproteobacteria bacterium]